MEDTMVKSVTLQATHEQLGAKMIPFAGYLMPVRYSKDIEEHNCVREKVGVFDVSHMGEFEVTGKGSKELLQYVTSNDVSTLSPGKIQYSCLPNDKGGIVDDLLVYMRGEDDYLLVVNASNIDKDWDWISSQNTFGADMINVSSNYCLLAVQGPKAVATLNKISSVDLSTMSYYTFGSSDFGELKDVFVSATGYTGSGGFEIMIENDKALALWDLIFEAGAEFGIQPIGLGARDTLRLEKGYCLYGNDIDDSTSPIEAGLGWITKFAEPFINSEYHAQIKKEGATKKLVGIKMIDRGIPRSHYEVLNSDGRAVGEITSGSMSPGLGCGIAMAYVESGLSKAGTEVLIAVRNKQLKAEVVKMPFI